MLQFDAETARILDDGYQGSDIARRRLANLSSLAPEEGDKVVDIGAGTGLLSLDLARAVGDIGTVFAFDPSEQMRTAAAARCAGRSNVQILEGAADALPLKDESVDRAVSLQVFEYLDNVPAALAEARRVLRPGGRLVIGDLHWDSHIWHADDRERMTRMLRLWDRHMVWRCLPAFLPSMLRDAGFEVDSVTPELCQDTTFRPDGLARLMTHLIPAYVRQNALADGDEIDAWVAEQHKMAGEGRFFFAITHYVISASRR
jgi:SAM-dependent methyltransferase